MILSFDPGGTTGWCLYGPGNETGVGQLETPQHHQELWELLEQTNPGTIVYEEFYNQTTAAELISKEYIGVLKLYAQQFVCRIVGQSPSQGKHFWTDSKIKELGLWVPGKPHAMDALRHMLYFVSFNQKDNRFIRNLILP